MLSLGRLVRALAFDLDVDATLPGSHSGILVAT
jgi:hypothetical protein